LYCSVDEAFRKYLAAAAKLPDGGNSIKRELYKEFMLIAASDDYRDWASANRCNEKVIRQVGGNIISPEAVERLRQILESVLRSPDA